MMSFGARSGSTFFLILLSCAAIPQSLRGQVVPVGNGAARDYVGNVYPFLGVDWGGNTFVGAAVPFGMVKLGPDMESFDGRPSSFGYLSGGRILGFSHLHLSGASGKYGNILVAPVTGALDLADIKSPRIEEVNHPGYYAATLTRYNVRAELTCNAPRGLSSLYVSRISAVASDRQHRTIASTRGRDRNRSVFWAGNVHLLSNHEAEGVGRYAGGWNKGAEYRVYFYIVLDTPASSAQTWSGGSLTSAQEASVTEDQPIGAAFNFPHSRGPGCSGQSGHLVHQRGAGAAERSAGGSRMELRCCPQGRSEHLESGFIQNSAFMAKRTPSAFSFIPRCITSC